MSGKPRAAYPTFPASCWWPLRERFKRALPPAVTADYLQAVLEVEPKTARNLVPMLRQMGLIDDGGVVRERGNAWRVDAEYRDVCGAIRDELYPAALRNAIPDPGAEFDAAVRWFMKSAGVGTAAAKRMARFYALLSKADPNDQIVQRDAAMRQPIARNGSGAQALRTDEGRRIATPTANPPTAAAAPPKPDAPRPADGITVGSIDLRGPAGSAPPPVQLVVQIQLPPGATAEQIDQLVASIARHLAPLGLHRP
jgi:hypothetical protein